MTFLRDTPVLDAVPDGGHVLISRPYGADPEKFVFAKVPASAFGTSGGGATGTTWDGGASVWDGGASVWDSPDAPSDGVLYGRLDAAWSPVPDGIAEPPSDGALYGRQNAAWAKVPGSPYGDWTTFGLTFDGVTDETAKFQAYLDYCRDNRKAWYLPADLVSNGVLNVYTSGTCAGGARILAKNNGENYAVIQVMPLAADILDVPSSEFNGWGDLFRGSAQVSGLSGRRGQYVTLTQTDVLIGRSGNPSLNQQVGFAIWSDVGDIYPPLGDTLTWPGTGTVVTAQVMRRIGKEEGEDAVFFISRRSRSAELRRRVEKALNNRRAVAQVRCGRQSIRFSESNSAMISAPRRSRFRNIAKR